MSKCLNLYLDYPKLDFVSVAMSSYLLHDVIPTFGYPNSAHFFLVCHPWEQLLSSILCRGKIMESHPVHPCNHDDSMALPFSQQVWLLCAYILQPRQHHCSCSHPQLFYSGERGDVCNAANQQRSSHPHHLQEAGNPSIKCDSTNLQKVGFWCGPMTLQTVRSDHRTGSVGPEQTSV